MVDLLLDSEYVPIIVNGDFVPGYSDNQHKGLLMHTSPGDWKESPDVGAAPWRFLESESTVELARAIRQQFTADGMVINKLTPNMDGVIEVDASYSTI
ncbi:MAG TPA: hypothetical protein PKD90_04460 [Phnomibacter sp.]|nr:hypothetical protein [Phnomibacter sp.]